MMEFLTDLIWIGNTLYPRWYVMLVLFAGFCAAAGFTAAVIHLIRSIR